MKISNKVWMVVIALISLIASLFGQPNWGSLIFALLLIIGLEICDLTNTMKEGIISHIIKYNIDANKEEKSDNEAGNTKEDI